MILILLKIRNSKQLHPTADIRLIRQVRFQFQLFEVDNMFKTCSELGVNPHVGAIVIRFIRCHQ